MANKNRTTAPLHEFTVYKNNGASFSGLGTGPTNYANTQNTISRSFTGNFFTINSTTTTPRILVYTNNGDDTFTDITANLDVPLTANAYSSAFSPTDNILAIGLGGTPFINFYSRTGTSFTKLAIPASLPGYTVACMGWSPNGTYLAVTSSANSPYYNIYKNNGDGTFTSLSGVLATFPTSGLTNGCTWSADSKYLAFVNSSAPYLHIYKNNFDDTFTKLSTPTIPANGLASGMFSPNGNYLALGSSATSTNTILILKNNNNDTFTLLTNPVTPTNTYITQDTLSWSQDSSMLIAGFNVPGYAAGASAPIRVYVNNGDDTFTIKSDITY